jgi:hypothetical protein
VSGVAAALSMPPGGPERYGIQRRGHRIGGVTAPRDEWRRVTAAVGLTAGMLLGGCGTAIVGGPAGPVPAPDVGGPFPECTNVELAFSGRTSLAAIGLGEFGGPDANKPGMIWVTAAPVSFGPAPAPGGPGGEPPDDRLVCVQWDDGSGMAGPVPDDWQPPGALDVEQPAASGPPVALIGLLVGAAVVAGVSYLAFRSGSS